MSETLTREERLRKGECSSSSELIKQIENAPTGGCTFAVRASHGNTELVHITKPKAVRR